MIFKAAIAFGIAAALMGTGPLKDLVSGPLNPGWLRVRADLAHAHPQARLVAQAHALFRSGSASDSVAPRPDNAAR
jgi:hypothetical protein